MSNADIGLIGLGTMGAMLSLNIAEKGFKIAVYNRTTQVMRDFFDAAGDLATNIVPSETIEDLVANVKSPHAIILMVPAGDAVDQQISELSRFLDRSDLIVDAGNANFRDTNRRSDAARRWRRPLHGHWCFGRRRRRPPRPFDHGWWCRRVLAPDATDPLRHRSEVRRFALRDTYGPGWCRPLREGRPQRH